MVGPNGQSKRSNREKYRCALQKRTAKNAMLHFTIGASLRRPDKPEPVQLASGLMIRPAKRMLPVRWLGIRSVGLTPRRSPFWEILSSASG
jgi:hypothetical protein